MEYLEFKTKLENYLKEYEIPEINDEKKIKRLYEYMTYILEKNQFINLTAIRNKEDFLKKHIVDSLYITKYLNSLDNKVNKFRYLDLGTGGGFPLVPIKIVKGYKSYGLDAILKKMNVINEKEPINIIHSRAEIAGHDFKYRETFDLVTTRAVSSISNVIRYMSPFVKVNSHAILLRGKEEELPTDIMKENCFKLVNKITYKLFDEDRTIYILRKTKKLGMKLPIKESKFYKEK